MNKMDLWDAVKQPPAEALKPILGGRLSGKTSIDPQWRYAVATEILGPCGIGWRYEIIRLWTEPGSEGQVLAFAEVKLYIRIDGEWSEAIPGIGGSTLVAKESGGLHSSDEGYKMAVTDALSVAFKPLGFGADIYLGRWDGSKYSGISADEGLIADWTAALQEVRNGGRDDLKAWWPEHKAEIIESIGEGGAAQIYAQFMIYLKAKKAAK